MSSFAQIIVATSKEEEAVRSAAQLFVDRGLKNGESAFAPGREVWSRGPVDELRAVFVDKPDFGSGDFVNKLKGQMALVSDDARLSDRRTCLLAAPPDGLENHRREKENRACANAPRVYGPPCADTCRSFQGVQIW